MTQTSTITVVRGPDGVPMCIKDLPPSNTTRWVPRRKAQVAAAVRGGLLSAAEAAARYSLSSEELDAWLQRIADNPLAGAGIRIRA